MNQEEAVKVFDLAVKGKMFPATMDKLVPLSFIGSAAVKFLQAKLKLMDQLGMSEAQRKATLADGQDAGEMLLNIEARIGELSLAEKGAPHVRDDRRPAGYDVPRKHERMGLREAQMHRAQTIHRNPAAVAAVIKQARENEDIPTNEGQWYIVQIKTPEQFNAVAAAIGCFSRMQTEAARIGRTAREIQGTAPRRIEKQAEQLRDEVEAQAPARKRG